MHGADRKARRPKDRMRALAELASDRLQLKRDPRGGGHRVAAQRRRRRVHRRALDDDAVVEQAAVGQHQMHRGRLREHRAIGLDAALDHRARAGRVLLLAHRRGERHVAGRQFSALTQRDDGTEHRRQAALHVARAAPVKAAAGDLGTMWVARPSLADGDGVDVAGEQKVRPAAGPPRRKHVGPAGLDLLH